ncbi:MAG: DUF6468 domain-containing protein [Alphaproteobacteria bacterium]|nr:DUF6468 domain-containing protein [Alphaproteobacteria bacterium]
MAGLFSFLLDLVLIGLLVTGIYYAVRLSRQIAGLRASRAEMERFVFDFGSTVERAEAGIRGLKQAARSSGDDLEQLIEKANALRDELHFLVESADRHADRLSGSAPQGQPVRKADKATVAEAHNPRESAKPAPQGLPGAAPTAPGPATDAFAGSEKKPAQTAGATSAAEKELLQALKKLG